PDPPPPASTARCNPRMAQAAQHVERIATRLAVVASEAWLTPLVSMFGVLGGSTARIAGEVPAAERIAEDLACQQVIVQRASTATGVGNIKPAVEEVGRTTGDIQCRERLGGILRYYHRQAA